MRDRIPPLVFAFVLVAASACGGRTLDTDPGAGESDGWGSGGGGPSTRSDDRLQPFELGRSWQYRQSVLNPALPASCVGPFVSRISDRVTVNDETGWVYYPTCIAGPVWMFLDGDTIEANVGSVSRLAYSREPVSEGTTWDQGDGIHFVWHDAGSVTVEAGTFDRCWQRALADGDDEYIVLCRGVGLVVTNVPNGNFRLELVSKNF